MKREINNWKIDFFEYNPTYLGFVLGLLVEPLLIVLGLIALASFVDSNKKKQ